MEEVRALGTTPLGGIQDADKIPGNLQSAVGDELREQRALDLADFMKRNLSNVFVNEAQSNPLQPDVQFRGFVGSPLLGLPQGIAVYQDGVRINEPFGDTVNWALIPESAIDTVYLMPGSNPLFGLNALGGAISIRTKKGSSHEGSSAEIYAGSFSRLGLEAETGAAINDRLSYFVTGAYLKEDGWQDFSPTEALQLFADVVWETETTTLDLNLTLADTDLTGNGSVPRELLAMDRRAVFTRPDQTRNELALLNLTAERRVSDNVALTGNVYMRRSDIETYNGDDSDFEECDAAPGLLCEKNGGNEELVFDVSGAPIAADGSLEGGTVNRTGTDQDGLGFAVQTLLTNAAGRRANRLIVGLTHDRSNTDFGASTELGALDASRLAVPAGIFVAESFTRMNADTSNIGVYISDTLALTAKLSLTASARYNTSRISLHDELGTALDGEHSYDRLNPAIGLTLAMNDSKTLYASYSESNRTPSPVELSCADANDPCRLPNAFLADPPLKQVIAKTIELGARGRANEISWNAGVFRTTNTDDILFISAGALTNQGFFDNVGRTRRDGLELGIDAAIGDRMDLFANYTWLEATFRNAFAVPSLNNPAAVAGEIPVERGDRLPLLPDQLLKAGLRIAISEKLTVSGEVFASTDLYFRGDEGNLGDQLDGYAVVSLRGEYLLNDWVRVFLNIDNLLGSDYETFGLFGDAVGVLGAGFDDGRFESPGSPRAAWLGVGVRF